MSGRIPHAQPSGIAVVVGGANLDLVAHPDAPLVLADSNPGQVVTSAGGVGHNIAENLARLGVVSVLMTVFGNDVNGRLLAEESAAAGVDVSHALFADVQGSLYLAILDAEGDLALAVSDMRAVDVLTPGALAARRGVLDSADIVVADANLLPESIVWLAEELDAPLVVDAVSTAKAPRVRGALRRTALLKANLIEAPALLAADSLTETLAPGDVASRLLQEGAGAVLVTLGADGVWYADAESSGGLAAPEVSVVNATGAGDAFTAGAVAARLAGLGVRETAAVGSATAALALRSDRTVSEEVSWAAARDQAEELIA